MVISSHGLLWQVFLTLILLVLLKCSVRAMQQAKVVLLKVEALVVRQVVLAKVVALAALLVVQKVAVQ